MRSVAREIRDCCHGLLTVSFSAFLLLFPVGAAAANLASVTVNPATVVAGSPLEVTVALDGPAPPGGVFVAVTSSPAGIVDVPSFSIAEGVTSNSAQLLPTGAVTTATTVTIQASSGGATKTATVRVTPRVPVRGVTGDLWADVILGKPDFGEIVTNEVTGRALFLPAGTIVDRSAKPNRVYVYDGGNSRVLGFNHLGTCAGGTKVGQNCTTNSDCPGSTCAIQEGRGADLVLGQPSFNRSACNGDGAFQRYPTRAPASAKTLCTMQEDQISVAEWIPIGNMFVDGGGNLYVPDSANNRVLRYNSPFTTNTIADAVWGQADFTGNECNRGASSPDAQGMCFPSGVALDSVGNLWVADFLNNRVLRFPHDSGTGSPGHTADLVLGQPGFGSAGEGAGLNQMRYPGAVRIDSAGSVYVADVYHERADGSGLGRVLIFDPPLSSGVAATRTLDYPFQAPTGLEVDPAGGIWVNDTNNNQLLLFQGGVLQKVLFTDAADSSGQRHAGCVGDRGPFTFPADGSEIASWDMMLSRGSIGIDGDGNVFASGFQDDVWRFPGPIPTPTPLLAHSADARLFSPYQQWIENEVGLAGLSSPSGIAVAADQLIVADGGRLLFWNHPPNFTNGQTAAGYVGVTDPRYQPPWLKFGRIREDAGSHLWANWTDQIRVYELPLQTGKDPKWTIVPPLPVLGGGSLTWDWVSLGIGGVAPVGAGDKVWIADPNNNRVFRIRDALTSPVVDILLGQTNASGTQCNQGRGETLTAPSRDSLCKPGAVRLDPQGNLYVADDAAEVTGNYRLLEYDAGLFPDSPASALFAIPASRVFGTGGSFTVRGCQWQEICTTLFEPAFSSNGQMVVGGNAYQSPRFPLVYTNPFVSQHVSSFLNDFYSWPQAATFDSSNNLYVVDGDRFRVLIYLNPLPNPPPATFTLTVTRIGSGSGTVTSTPPGIDCGADCSQSYVNGTVVSLGTVPDTNFIFAGWSGDADCADGVVTMSANKTCTARFDPAFAKVWVGLKNGDDVGANFDLKAEVLRSSTVIGSGEIDNVPGGSSAFGQAALRTIGLVFSSTPVSVASGETLSIRLSVRIGATGHRSGTARLWYGDAQANSRFSATVNGVTADYYLRDGFVLGMSAGPGPKKTIDVFVDRLVGGNPFKPFGTWSVMLP